MLKVTEDVTVGNKDEIFVWCNKKISDVCNGNFRMILFLSFITFHVSTIYMYDYKLFHVYNIMCII